MKKMICGIDQIMLISSTTNVKKKRRKGKPYVYMCKISSNNNKGREGKHQINN